MKTKIEIKSVFGSLLFTHESENNTIKETVLEAIKSYADLRCADLSYADLRCANLSYANLRCADLRSADLRSANLSYADLRSANLSYADLRSANLSSANLSSANLSYADLRSANLRSANLSSADLRYADLRSANLSSANLSSANLSYVKHNEGTGFLLSQCPTEGSFIAWKKARGMIVKLLVTEDAKRSSATTLKCRCSKAKVLGIENIDGTDSGLKTIASNHDNSFVYKVGKIIEVKDFDDDRFNECSSGIHFFIARESAVAY